jgi:hypothetical protein
MLLAAANDPYPWDIAYCGAVLTRSHTDGRRDDSFGIDGVKQVPLGECATFGGAMLIDPNGNIVVDGTNWTNDVPGPINSLDYVVTRLSSSGDIDRSFAVDGQAVLDVGDGRYMPYASASGSLVRQDDGKLVIVTSGIRALVSRGGDNHRMVLARLQAGGGSPGLIGIKAVDPKIRASDGRVPILIRRSGGSQGIVSVDYSTAAVASSQGFNSVSGTLVWGDGDRADKLIAIQPMGGFKLLLANATGGAELARSEIETPTTSTATPPSTAISPTNSNTGGGGGTMSWQVLILMALAVLRLAWSSRARRTKLR